MDAEEQNRKLKQIPQLTKAEKRKKLTTAITLALAALISVLFLIYAFIQKQQADTFRKEAGLQQRIHLAQRHGTRSGAWRLNERS